MAKIRLVVVDNREIFREGLTKLLKSESSIGVVCTCTTGLEAVESVHKHRPDVILIDTELPEFSVAEIVQRIHEELPKTNIIVFTHSEKNDDLIAAIAAGARAYLSKDISFENLIKCINLVAEGGIVVSPPMASRLLANINSLDKTTDTSKSVNFLSERERAVLSVVAQGSTNKEIATTLFITENTVKVHLRNIMEKLHAHTRQQAVSIVGEKNLLHSVTQTETKQSPQMIMKAH